MHSNSPNFVICLFGTVVILTGLSHQDPTLYQHYTAGGIKSGLETNSDQFTLNGKHFVIYSGSFHYFRVPTNDWPSILAKFRAAGLNTVQLYLPWNLHEMSPGHFDFESINLNLNLVLFLDEIKRQGMFAIVRPGPYICAEWEMGGYPSWLLRDPNMKLRSNYQHYLDRVKIFWDEALKIINRYQFTKNGGPVIALQLENEYSGNLHHIDHSKEYLNFLRNTVINSGFKEFLFQSDPVSNAEHYPIKGIFPNNSVLQTANLNADAYKHLVELKKNQPNRPVFVTEFWPGWFDQWGDKSHHTYSVERFEHEVSDILFKLNGSINFYMFIGGTNFGFTNGAHVVTSYDYDAPLSEAGEITPKWNKTRELYLKLVETGRLPKIDLPKDLAPVWKKAYGKFAIKEFLPFETVLQKTRKFPNQSKPVPMELLNYNQEKTYGQRFGYILYRVEVREAKTYEITGKLLLLFKLNLIQFIIGQISDRGIMLVDNTEQVVVFNVPSLNHTFASPLKPKVNGDSYKLDILVENMGRPNYGDEMNHARKGILSGEIKVDGKPMSNLTIYSMEFDQNFMDDLTSPDNIKKLWHKYEASNVDENHSQHQGPALYRTEISSNEFVPESTYLSLPGWTKGNVFVNGFNVGRYWPFFGPQKTLYIPGKYLHLHSAPNDIVVLELHRPGLDLDFLDHPML